MTPGAAWTRARLAARIYTHRARRVRAITRVDFPFRAPTIPAGAQPGPSKGRYGSDYDTDWSRRFPARLARVAIVEGVMRPVMALVADPTRRNADLLDDVEGAVVFAANHHSHVDTPLLITSIPEPFRHRLFVGAGADYFFTNAVTSTLSALAIGAIPIERQRVSRRSADQAAGLIDDGWSLLIYPEGGRSPDGWGQEFRRGAAYLAKRCGVPIVPIHVEGTGRILPKGRGRPRPSRTTVTFGRPLRAGPDEDARALGARVEAAVAALADEAMTDWYAARLRAHASETPALTGPDAPTWRRTWALGDRGARRRRTDVWKG